MERTRTYTGTLPVNPAHDAWQQAHDEMCTGLDLAAPQHDGLSEPLADALGCDHTNPYPETVEVLVHVFEGTSPRTPRPTREIKGIQVAVHNGEPGRMSRWTPPAQMEEVKG